MLANFRRTKRRTESQLWRWLALLAFCFFSAVGARAAATTNLLLTITDAWRYQTNNLDGVPAWKTFAYDDSAWFGPSNALLYIESATLPAPKNTPLPPKSGGGPLNTYYFRTTFQLTNAASVTYLVLSNLIDDGAVFYVNGAEVSRVRMPAGAISYSTFATDTPNTTTVGDATNYETVVISSELLTNLLEGTNVLAAEVHQVSATSSDVVFGSAVTAVWLNDPFLFIPAGALWKYHDDGTDLGTNWISPAYNDSTWAAGFAQLGFGDGDEATVINGGPSGARYMTTYFRRAFTVADPSPIQALEFRQVRDDGTVIYLNGVELFRSNMDPGPVTFSTAASTSVTGADESAVYTNRVWVAGLLTGTNVIAVELHQINPDSSDLSFELEVSGLTNAAVSLLRGPYLQLSTPTAISIRWRTDLPCASRVIYGTNPAALNLTNLDTATVTEHEVRLAGLTPDTVYYYAIGAATTVLEGPGPGLNFLTHPAPGSTKPIRVWIIGDAGTGTPGQIAVRDEFESWNGTNRVHAWLQLGDNAYNSGFDNEFQARFFNIYTNEFRRIVTWPTLGNHETDQSSAFIDTYAQFLNFTLPTAGEAGGVASGTEHYYSFDCGPAHFVCLDSMTADRATNAAMATWLRADLAANTNRWVIAYWHHPPYSKGSHDSDFDGQLAEMRQNFLPILEAGGVDLVLSGHSHAYERSMLIDGHYDSSWTFTTNMIVQPGGGRDGVGSGAYAKPEPHSGGPVGHRGAVYVVAGSSGQTSGGDLNHPAMFISLNLLGSMVLDISSNRLDAKFLRETNSIDDWFTLVKTNFAPVASNRVYAIAADAPANLTLTGNDANRDSFTFSQFAGPTNGLISNFNPVTGTFTYTPAHGARSGDALTFTASDSQLTGSPGVAAIVITPPLDANTNGLPDAWESFYSVSDPAADPDGDGVSNLQEYYAGTNPTNALSWLHITQLTGGGGSYQLVWSAIGGTRYRVHFSDGDSNGGFNSVFTPIVRPVTAEMDGDPIGVPGTRSFTDDYTLTGGPPAHGNRYYRIEVVR
ncbi:MAG: metallophosphoesterase family protein [Verrucomicrobia bacterium]|nr:MAG: metallophosphoesterase family protein [Verrucomicrobiota bacterium]